MRKLLMDLEMKKKLLLSPFVVLACFVAFGIVAYIGLVSQKSALGDIFKNRFKGYQESERLLNTITYAHSNVYKVLSWVSSNYDSGKVDSLGKEQVAAINGAIDAVEKRVASAGLLPAEKEKYAVISDQVKKYKADVEKVLDMADADSNLAITLMKVSDDRFQVLNKSLQELSDLENRLSDQSYASSVRTFTKVVLVLALVVCAAVALSLFTSFFMTRLILGPIKKTVEVIEAVADGDLTKRIAVESKDEVGGMALHFNAFVEKLHETMTQVAASSNEVSRAAGVLDKSTEHMAQGVEEAAVQINAVATASEDMSKTSTEIAQNCVTAAQNSDGATGSASTGDAIIGETIDVMGRISNRVKESSNVIKNLGARSDQIGQIVGLINDVADQTNLLALNAAIEAARAGEHGRGFAVVADEVRKLAERTSSATKEISETIRAMQVETRKAVSSMDEGVSEVDLGTAEAAKSGEALKDILSLISNVTAEINQIAVASEEATATTNEIASNIQQISQTMKETARRIQENASASSQLADLSKGLEEMVRQFRL